MSSAAIKGLRFRKPSEIPPLRADPFAPDALDKRRAEWVMGLWHAQDERLRARDRQVEENVRMLLGQHWIVWSKMRQRYVDLAEHLSDDEKRWRHMPVLNRLFLWFVLTHARMNENPPVITWQPGPDRIDAELAEVMDPVFKYLWRDVGMMEVLDRLTSWLIPSGRAHLKSRIDPTRGDPIEARGPATLQLLGPAGSPILGADGSPIQREIPDAPLDQAGKPLARLTGDPTDPQPEFTGDPHMFAEGVIDVDVLTCLEVRGEWGEHIPWHKKGWHIHRSLLTPLQVWETFGIEVEPDVRGQSNESIGVLWRMLHGSGLFGAADSERVGETQEGQEFVTVYELWQKPGRFPGTQRTPQSPGGRLTIVTGGGHCFRDGVRNAPFKYTSPIRCIDFTNLPGRPQGTSPQEMLNGPVRTRNRLYAQGIAHATLLANPVRILDRGAGIEPGTIRNVPGEEILADRSRSTAPPMEYVQAPLLGPEVYEGADRLASEVDQLGSISGTEGSAPTEDASGELVKELRFNSDRPLAAPLKRMVTELARLGEDWKVMIPLVWDQEKVLQIVGEDGIGRTLTVWPHLFEDGTVNAEPEVESMLPEGRGERQTRMFRFWQSGVWGDPRSPEAINTFLQLARFPHMGQAVRPGGADRSTAEQNVGRLLQGVPAVEIPVFEWYEHALHLMVLERFMKSPEYLKIEPDVQQEFVTFREIMRMAEAEKAIREASRQLAVQAPVQRAASVASADIESEADKHRPDTPVEGEPRSRPKSTAVA